MYTIAVSIHLSCLFSHDCLHFAYKRAREQKLGRRLAGLLKPSLVAEDLGTFLSKVTVGTAIVFMLSSLSLSRSLKRSKYIFRCH